MPLVTASSVPTINVIDLHIYEFRVHMHSHTHTHTLTHSHTHTHTHTQFERLRQRVLKTSKQLTEVFTRVIEETALRQQKEKKKVLESNKRMSERESQQGIDLEYLSEVIVPPRY